VRLRRLCHRRSGQGILGFGFAANGQRTTLTASSRSGALAASYYFRKSFTVTGVAAGADIIGYLNYLVDDGAVVYINGVEVGRHAWGVGLREYFRTYTHTPP
jgi:hypothetical protein